MTNQRITFDMIDAQPGFVEYVKEQFLNMAEYGRQYGVTVVFTVAPLEDEDEQQTQDA